MERSQYIRKITLTGGLVNFILVIFKFYAGIWGDSSAMVADAVHSLSDFGSDIIILLCIRVSARPEDEDHAYGHGKFETLAAVLVGLFLLACGIGFFWDGIRLITDYFKGLPLMQPGWLALLAAIISIVVKESLYHYTKHAAEKIDSEALRVNAWHHRSDALSSLATLAGISGAMLGPRWLVLDPLAACVISLFIVWMAFSLMKPAIDELMEKSLPQADKDLIKEIISATPGVYGWHHLRTRRVGGHSAIEAHIKLDGEQSLRKAHDIASALEKSLKQRLGPDTHVGIHMEPKSEHSDKAHEETLSSNQT